MKKQYVLNKNGNLTKSWKDLLTPIKTAIDKLLLSNDAQKLNYKQFKNLTEYMESMMLNAVCEHIPEEFLSESIFDDLMELTNEEFITYIKDKYGEDWLSKELETEELMRFDVLFPDQTQTTDEEQPNPMLNLDSNKLNKHLFFDKKYNLTEDGINFLIPIKNDFKKILHSNEIKQLDHEQFGLLVSYIENMWKSEVDREVPIEFASKWILNGLMKFTDDEFINFLKDKYGDNWVCQSLNEEEVIRSEKMSSDRMRIAIEESRQPNQMFNSGYKKLLN